MQRYLIFFAVCGASGAPCDATLPGYWGGSRNNISFGDSYHLTWSTFPGFDVRLVHGPNCAWSTATGNFSGDANASVSILFNTGYHAVGAVSPNCDLITWPDKSSWTPIPAPPPQPAACSAITSPAPCGQSSDSAERCLSKGCCFNAALSVPCFYSTGDAVPITNVHVLQASHFDAGFAYTISGVLSLWWYTHYPRALTLGLEIAANATLAATVGLQFTTQCWILNTFFNCPPNVAGLTCPTPAQVANVTRSIHAGYLTWHAFPFNSELELHSAGALAAGVASCHALDDKFGVPRKATLSQRDVPGTTRAAIAPLLAQGVSTISIGVNGASTPPFVPRAFLWNDTASGASMPTLVHPYGYGGIEYEDAVIVPGLDHALVFAWRGDNQGPPDSVAEIEADFASVRQTFPGAAVFSSTFDNFTAHLQSPAVVASLPVVTSELGDTWIHGAASDPIRLAFMSRAFSLRDECVAAGTCNANDPQIANFTNFILKCGEHTWGADVKTFLHDTTHWSNAELQSELANPNASNFIYSVGTWNEQRSWCVDYAIAALAGHSLAPAVAAAAADLHPPGAAPPPPSANGFNPFTPGVTYDAGCWTLGFDASTGALTTLKDCATGVAWALPADGTSLLWPHYVTLNQTDYDIFTGGEPNGYYPLPGDSPDWYKKDFGKPNCSEGLPVHREVAATLRSLWLLEAADVASFLVETAFAEDAHALAGAPEALWLRLDVPRGAGGGAINVTLDLFNKTATRLPEGLFLRFNASATRGWRFTTLGSDIDPFDVVPGGNQHLHGAHAVSALAGVASRLDLAAGEIGLASVGRPWPLPAPVWPNSTTPKEGMGYMLIGNTWGAWGAGRSRSRCEEVELSGDNE